MANTTDNPSKEAQMLKELLDEINHRTVDTISTWAEMYDAFKKQINAHFMHPSEYSAEFTLALMLSFILALEELPDEGDVKVILTRTNEILITEPSRTGIELIVDRAAFDLMQVVENTYKAKLDPTDSFIDQSEEGSFNGGPKRTLH